LLGDFAASAPMQAAEKARDKQASAEAANDFVFFMARAV
jgi:hypothetical protein